MLGPDRDEALRKSRRFAAVDLDLAPLRHAERDRPPRFVVGTEAIVELFPGEAHRFVGTRVEDSLHGVSTWVGRLRSETDEGEATISVRDSRVHATIEVGTRRFVVESRGAETGWVREIDPRREGRCLTGDPGRAETRAAKRSTSTAATSSSLTSSTIDVLVLYTYGVETTYGEPWVEAANFVASMNSALSAGGIDASARVVHLASVNYSDPSSTQSFYDAISDMRQENGAFSGLGDLRDEHHADVVVLLSKASFNMQGCGTIGGSSSDTPLNTSDLQSQSTASAAKAHAVVTIDCAASDYTFTHEIGHLLGGWHDYYFDQPCGIEQQSCGHTNLNAPFRTLMGQGITGEGFPCSPQSGCPRINRFSDPNATYFFGSNYWDLGAGSHTYVAATIDSTAPFVGGYRNPSGSAPGAPDFSVATCYAFQTATWSPTSGTVGWYELETDSSVSFTSPSLVYRGGATNQYLAYSSPFYARLRACNGVGCSAWSTSSLNDPAYCP